MKPSTQFTDVYMQLVPPDMRPEYIRKIMNSIEVLDRSLKLIPWYDRWLSPLNEDRYWLVANLETLCKAALREGVITAHSHYAI